jgi:hypothetical protein
LVSQTSLPRDSVFLYSLIAYGAAIALKYAVQIPTVDAVTNYFGAHSVGLGVYYGLQTVFFEVGLAFLVAWFAVSRGALEKKDAEAYGSGLAFCPNWIDALQGHIPSHGQGQAYSIPPMEDLKAAYLTALADFEIYGHHEKTPTKINVELGKLKAIDAVRELAAKHGWSTERTEGNK